MQTKLTLRMDEETIAQAKVTAQLQGKSISQLVADYFAVLGEQHQPQVPTSEVTKSLRGLLKQANLPMPDEEDYKQHLLQKHL
jgi:hypothetical protein